MHSKGEEFAPTYDTINSFVEESGWDTFQDYPRFVGDINGDKIIDIIGFYQDGVKFSLGQKDTCSRTTPTMPSRDLDNWCHCKDGYYDAGDSFACPECVYPCEFCSSSTVCLSNKI